MNDGPRALERAHLVRLVVVDRQAVALAVADAVDVLARDPHAARVGRLLPVMSSNSVVLPEPFGPMTPTIVGASTTKVGLERERHLARRSGRGV